LTIRSPFLDNDLVGLVYQAPHRAMSGHALSHRLIKNGNPRLFEITTDRGIGGKSNLFFSKSAPIFQELTFKAEYAYDYGMPQWVAKLDFIFKSLHFERLFLGRHKFYHFRTWYRNELSDYVRDILLDRRTIHRPYLNKGVLQDMVKNHIRGNCNYTTEIHKILTLELIHRLFIDP
jgi:asparagine synthase (glutamine-hydrolysing)